MRSLGAAHVVDYTREDFTDRPGEYDVILDNVGNRPLRPLRRALTSTGTLVLNSGGRPGRMVVAIGPILRAVVISPVVRQRLRPLIAKQNRADVLTLAGLMENGSSPRSWTGLTR